MGALAEMERELIIERTRAGLAAARAQGRHGGRPQKLTEKEREQIARLLANGESRKQIALIFDIGLSTFIVIFLPHQLRHQKYRDAFLNFRKTHIFQRSLF